jgi:hypothetical protein
MIYSRSPGIGLYLRKGRLQSRRRKQLVNQAVPLASFDPHFEGHQHPCRPNRRFRPRPVTLKCCRHWALSDAVSHLRHSRRFLSVNLSRHVSTFLHPFAPPELPGFFAHMSAVTPARRCVLHILTPSHGLSPCRSPRFMHSVLWEPSVSNHPTVPHDRFSTYVSVTSFLLAQVWASPFPLGLASQHGRNEFTLLRTTPSPPVAPHPTSW